MNLLEISYTPAVLVSSMDTVKRAVAATVPVECDAMTVTDHGQLKGILTSRDVMLRVVLKRRDPHTTLVRDVMTKKATRRGVTIANPGTRGAPGMRPVLSWRITWAFASSRTTIRTCQRLASGV